MNAMTWFDHETNSIWSQPWGIAISGPLKGTRLDMLPFSLTLWASWQTEHPDTLATRNLRAQVVNELGRDQEALEEIDELREKQERSEAADLALANVEVTRSVPPYVFDREAIRAVRRWRYNPNLAQSGDIARPSESVLALLPKM